MVIDTPKDTYHGQNQEYSDENYESLKKVMEHIDSLDYLSVQLDDGGSKMFFPGTLLKNSVAFIEVFDKI